LNLEAQRPCGGYVGAGNVRRDGSAKKNIERRTSNAEHRTPNIEH